MEGTTLVRKPLHPNQHAFRRGKGTDTALGSLVDIVESSILRKQLAIGLFFDIEGAFDQVNPDKVVEAMTKHGFDEKTVEWYSHYLSARKVKIDIFGKEYNRNLTRGSAPGRSAFAPGLEH